MKEKGTTDQKVAIKMSHPLTNTSVMVSGFLTRVYAAMSLS
jgi:hypothetical protein